MLIVVFQCPLVRRYFSLWKETHGHLRVSWGPILVVVGHTPSLKKRMTYAWEACPEDGLQHV